MGDDEDEGGWGEWGAEVGGIGGWGVDEVYSALCFNSMRVFLTVISWSNENKSCIRVD